MLLDSSTLESHFCTILPPQLWTLFSLYLPFSLLRECGYTVGAQDCSEFDLLLFSLEW